MRFIFLMLISLTAHADWFPESKVNECGSIMYHEKSYCESKTGEVCFEKTGEDVLGCGYFSLEDITEDDLEKPIRNKTQVTTCVESHETELDEEGNTVILNEEIPTCLSALAEKVCSEEGADKFINEDQTEVYCSRITGYEQKVIGKKLVIDENLKAQKEAEQAAKLAMENALIQAKKAMECGKNIQALLLVRNSPKQLTTAQVKEMVSIYAPIKQLLDTGSLVSAKEEILSVTADGILVTEADKVALVAEIDKCTGN